MTFQEYVAFNRFIEKCDILKMKIATYKYMTVEMLRELCDDFQAQDEFCLESGAKISDIQLEAFFKMLDVDNSEALEYDEIVGVLEGRKNVGVG